MTPPGIFNYFISFLGGSRDRDLELFLIKFLESTHMDNLNPDRIFRILETLGRSGSKESLPLLKEMVLHRSRGGMISPPPAMRGAAQALVTLSLAEADAILETGARSLIPAVRTACRQALKNHSDWQKKDGSW